MEEAIYLIKSEGKPTLKKSKSELRNLLQKVYSDDSIDLIFLVAENKPVTKVLQGVSFTIEKEQA